MAKSSGKNKVSADDRDRCRLVTPEFRLSYPHLFKPHAPKPSDKPKFSATMLYPKDREMMGIDPISGEPRSIKKAIANAKRIAFGKDKADWPKGIVSPIIDGDDPKFADKEGYKGHWVVKAITNEDQPPVAVDQKMKAIIDPNDVYPGCYCRAHIFAYTWEYMGKQGVGFILDHVQKLRDGKSFGGKKPVEAVFSPVESDEDDSDDNDEDEEDDENDFR